MWLPQALKHAITALLASGEKKGLLEEAGPLR
jgi:hypothetical protein